MDELPITELRPTRHRNKNISTFKQSRPLGVGDRLLTLPDQLQVGLGWIANYLDRWIPRSLYAIGGGTILAAHRRHRVSAAIDLFAEEKALNDVLDPITWREIAEALNQEASAGSISELLINPSGFSFTLPSGPVSFYAVPHLTATPISDEREGTTGIFAEHTSEILFKKLRGRMVNANRYVARDLYDIVICYIVDKESLDEAMDELTPLEHDSLRYDVQKGDADLTDLDRILKPAYPDLVSNLERFNHVAGKILVRSVSTPTDRFLTEIGVTA